MDQLLLKLKHHRLASLTFVVIYYCAATTCPFSSVSAQRDDLCIELTARFAMGSPDGVLKELITINGQFPGPTIRVKKYDTVTIRVRNELIDRNGKTHATSVHFHGIEMRGTPWFDGPEQVAQCPIPYGHVMNYTFTLGQSGTYWYHSHHAWQYTDGFWGILVVENVPAEVHPYDDELTLSLADWHHRSGTVLSKLLHLPRTPSVPEAGNAPIPDSALINGLGNADCDLARLVGGHVCDPEKSKLITIFDVVPFWTYRLRLVNPSARASFRFSIDGLQLRVIETDGVDTVEGGPVDEVEIWPAQRYSFLVTMNGSAHGGNYWIRARMVVAGGSSVNQTRIGAIAPLAVLHFSSPGRLKGFNLTSNQGKTFQTSPSPPHAAQQSSSSLVVAPFSSIGGGEQGRAATAEIVAASLSSAGFGANKNNSSNNFVEESNFEPILPFSSTEEGQGGGGGVVVDKGGCARFETPTANRDKSQKVRIHKEYLKVFSVPNPTPVVLDQRDCCSSLERVGVATSSAPQTYDTEVVLNAQFVLDEFNMFKGTINGSSYSVEESSIPAVFRVVHDGPSHPLPDSFCPVETPILGQVVQLVINNLNSSAGTGAHPWHLHGHTFWVMGTGRSGDGAYSAGRDSGKLDIVGLRRDTTHTPPNSWTVLRYIVDNPGVWLMHCHIHWHLEIGLGAVFVEGRRQLKSNLQIPPEAKRMCWANGIRNL